MIAAPSALLITHMDRKPITSADITPETSEKRSSGAMYDQENTSSVPPTMNPDTFSERPIKKMKVTNRPPPLELGHVYVNQIPYEQCNWAPNGNTPLNGPNPSPVWHGSLGLSAPPPHLSPYPHSEWNSAPPTEYVRSPQLDFDLQAPHASSSQSKFGTHLAPMASHPIPSPVESTFSQSQVGYFPRSHSAAGFLPHQQTDYMQQHQLQQQQLHHHQQQQQQFHHQLQQQQQMAQTQLAPPQPSFDYGAPFIHDLEWTEQGLNSQ